MAGLLLGASWLTKETVIYLFPLLAGVCLVGMWKKKPGILLVEIAVGIGFGTVLAAEAALYQHKTGDALFRIHETQRNFEQCKENFFYEDSPAYGWRGSTYGKALWRRLAIDGLPTILLDPKYLCLGLLALAAAIFGRLRGTPNIVLVSLWFMSLLVLFNCGSTSLQTYRPLVLNSRYYYMLVLPAALLLGGFANHLLGSGSSEADLPARRRLRSAAIILAGTGFAFAAAAIATSLYLSLTAYAQHRALADALARVPQGVAIVTDFRSVADVSYYLVGVPEPVPSVVTAFEGSTVPPPDGSFVLINRPTLSFLGSRYGYAIPLVFAQNLPSWRRVWAEKGVELYEVTAATMTNPQAP